MKEFKDLSSFSKYLNKINSKYDQSLTRKLSILGEYLEKEAKKSIGHLQSGAGSFREWEELADSTKRDKERLGYVENSDYNPLLRTGHLRDSIHHRVRNHKLSVGSDDEVMIYQEMGTIYIPPRSVLGMTMYKNRQIIAYELREFMKDWVSNKPQKKVKFIYG